jgi:hypothetical protein
VRVDGQVDVVDHRALFDLGPPLTDGTANLGDNLLDHELDVGAPADVGENPDVFEAHHGPDDLDRVSDDKGAARKLAHTTTLEHLRHLSGGIYLKAESPPESEEPQIPS